MKKFKEFLAESSKQDLSVDFHLAGHFASGKSTAVEKAQTSNNFSLIDLDEIFSELVKKYGKPKSTSTPEWESKFKRLYTEKVLKAKKKNKPIVVVGHHWEGSHRIVDVDAKEKVYIDISKNKVFQQRKERDHKDKKLTDAYLEREYKSVQNNLDKENYIKLPFNDIVKRLKELK